MQTKYVLGPIALAALVGGLWYASSTQDADTLTASQPAEKVVDAAPAATELTTEVATDAPAQAKSDPLPMLGTKPELENIQGWFNTEADSLDDFDGQVKIVQFWTFSCHNCTATIPHLQNIYSKWEPEGLEIIGIHAPEFDFEKDPDAVKAAAKDLGVTWPVALDPTKTNFRNWQDRRFWPRTFVLDQNNQVRFDRIGEGRYDDLEATVAQLLTEGP